MGLFSFGNKDASASSGRGSQPSGSTGRASRRGADRAERGETEGLRRRRQSEPADANMLDPTLPEKQRARRRLIGAIALVLAAVVILPMVLDSHPKPATDGIAIEIPAHDDAPAPGATASSASTAAFDADDESAASTPATTGVAAPAQANSAVTLGTGTHTTAANGASTSLNTASKAPSSGKAVTTPSPNTTTAANVNAATNNDGAAATTGSGAGTGVGTTTAKAPTANDAPPAGSHFVVQIGSFASEAPAQAWVVKLKAAGVPAYVQHARQDDGSDRVLVRAGPFADRAAAEAAVRKVRTVDSPADAAAAGH